MKIFAIPLELILSVSAFGQTTARDYYKELYDAGGLDRMADEYVCFQEDSKVENFFIFGQSKSIRQLMIEHHTFNKMPKATQEQFKKEFLIMRSYRKGVPSKDEAFFEKDGDSWVTDKFL